MTTPAKRPLTHASVPGDRARLEAMAGRKRTPLERMGLSERGAEILSGILTVASEGILVTDSAMRILLFSKGAEAIFGYRAGELQGQSLERLIPVGVRSEHRLHVARFAMGPTQSRRMTTRKAVMGLTKDGRDVPLEVGLSRISTPEGVLFTALVRDISEQVEAEARLSHAVEAAEAASRAKSAFLAAMSHEIRTPLNGVLGMAQALALEPMPERQRERIEVIRQSGQALLAILNDVLDLSKIEAGKLALEETKFEIETVTAAAHATFAALASAKGLALELDVAAAARGSYLGDPLRLRQILQNLISNAVKFTERGGVSVRVSRGRDGVLKVTVSDTGVGMNPETVRRLFSRFEQGDASTTRQFGGTGLGLAISRDIAALMGGTIAVRSTLGKGSTFTLRAPLKWLGAPAVDGPHAPDPGETAPVTPQRILIAEDNATNQLVLKTLLNQFGLDPVIVNNGREAVEAWRDGQWDLVLMDVQMPEMDGPTAVGLIRVEEAARRVARTRIVALTANVMTHQVEAYLAAGMDDVLAKPIEVQELFAKLTAGADQPLQQQADGAP